MQTDQEIIDVVTAHRDGKAIESRTWRHPGWVLCRAPSWDFVSIEYRVKPEPREWWIVSYGTPGMDFGCYDSEHDAKRFNSSATEYIKVREVLK